MIRKYEITGFENVVERINKPITKFGGQPIWIRESQWPISSGWNNRQMMFIGQIALTKNMLGNKEDLMLYIFVTHPESYEDTFFDPDVTEWNGGENAVIIQPTNINNCEICSMKEGPALFDEFNNKIEYIPIMREAYDPEFISDEEYRKLDSLQQSKYFEAVDTNKIGGVPNFFRGDAWPEGEWILLLQLKCDFLPFELRLGDMPLLYVFISKDFKKAGLLIQD